jgi:hypothetical protein
MWALLFAQLFSFLLVVSAVAAAAPCTLNPASPSVTICTPANGATVSSPVTLTAGTTDNAHPVTAMIAYVDNNSVDKVNANQLSTSLTLTSGQHNITVNAWDSSGAVFKSTVIVTSNGTGTPSVSVAVTPSAATLAPGATEQFSATVLNTTNTAVTWSVDGFFNGNTTVGTITTGGLYTAPATNGTHNIVATSAADPTKSDTAIVTVTSSGGGSGTCSSTSGPPSVTICNPASGATVTSPVQISAVGNSSTPITKMLVYVDSVLQFQTTTSSNVNISLSLANGSHNLTVQFYNGAWVIKSESFTVGGTPIKVGISPTSATLAPAGTQQFTASVTGSSNTAVNWSVDGVPGGNSTAGTVSSAGLYTAPSASGAHTVTATSQASSAASASATVTVSSSVGTCSPASGPPSVTICTPAAGSTVASPVTVTAVGNSSTPITEMLVYFDSVLQFQTTAGSVNTSIAAGNGSHNLTVQFYNGAWIKQSETFTVSGSTGGTNVLTWHYDNERTGLNPNESNLTPANVNASNFGKLFSYLVDGYVYAQPLYVSNLTIGGVSHNAVFVATENDSVYAFDADQYGTGSPLWRHSLLQSGETPQAGSAIKPFQGVTSTPVIDLASGTLYVVSSQKAASSPFFRLHALDLLTGAEKFGGPVVIAASVKGTNSESVNGVVSLTTSCVQRAALLLADNTVFIGFGGCHSGWLLSYNAQTLAQSGVFNMSPNINGYGTYGGAGGVWMGGGGPAADSNGSIYVTTGNGPYDGSTSFGDSVMKFNAQLTLLDHFTPDDFAFLECRDADLSAGGLLLLPGTSQALVGGKTGKMYLVNTAKLGGVQANDAGATQWLWFEQDLSPAYSTTCTDNNGNALTSDVTSYQIYGTAAFFNNTVYLGVVPSLASTRGPVRQFPYANGLLTPGAVTADSIAPNSYGTTPFISANGTTNGIVWVLDHGLPIQDPDNVAATSAILRAYNATNLTQELYNSAQNASDAAGLGIKFTSPIVVNGKVYIGTGHDPVSTTNPQGELNVYGLKP